MPDPLIVTQANEFRAALLRREATQLRAMTRRWMTVERRLEQGIAETLELIAIQERRGNRRFGRNPGTYLQLERYQALLAQTRGELGKFADYAEGSIKQGIFDFARLGVEQSTAQIVTAAQDVPAILGSFNRMSVAAVENMAGVLQDSAPVGELLRAGFPEAAVRMTDALIEGTALGWNPRKTAAEMARGLEAGALQRTMVIARSEQLRASRTAMLENYRQSEIVRGYRVLASKSARTCLACLVNDGTFYELTESYSDHPQGRCVMVPCLKGRDDPQWTRGREWFERQPAPRQRLIMGTGAYNAWRDGAVSLDDLVQKHTHPTWGTSLGTRALRDAVGAEAAKAYSASAFYTQD